jgi:hypothetical protein
MACGARRTNLYPVGVLTRSKVPHARCEGAGSKGDGTILYRGVFQPYRDPVTHPPWIS